MPRREEIDIRQSTNLYDLLDDGVENGSDLPALVRLKSEPVQSSDATPIVHRAALKRTLGKIVSRRSWSGAFLGTALLMGGTAVATWPVEMMVWHHRIRYLPSFVEHVTSAVAQGYGIAVAAIGLVVLALSLVRLPSYAGRT